VVGVPNRHYFFPWVRFWAELICGLQGVISTFIAQFQFMMPFQINFTNTQFNVFNLSDIAGRASSLNQELLSEILDSFPLRIVFSENDEKDLCLSINFMEGTEINQNAFVDIEPENINENTLETFEVIL